MAEEFNSKIKIFKQYIKDQLMKKNLKIAMTCGIIAIIAIPSLYFGINSYINSQVQSASVSINQIQLLDLDNDNMVINASFNVNIPTQVNAAFNIENVQLQYENSVLGTAVLSKSEFQTTDTQFQSIVNITVSNFTVYSQILQDFISKPQLNFSINAQVQFTGALSSIPVQNINKSVEITALNGLNFSINSFNLIDWTQNNLQAEIQASFNNTSVITANIPGLLKDHWKSIQPHNLPFFAEKLSDAQVIFISIFDFT